MLDKIERIGQKLLPWIAISILFYAFVSNTKSNNALQQKNYDLQLQIKCMEALGPKK